MTPKHTFQVLGGIGKAPLIIQNLLKHPIQGQNFPKNIGILTQGLLAFIKFKSLRCTAHIILEKITVTVIHLWVYASIAILKPNPHHKTNGCHQPSNDSATYLDVNVANTHTWACAFDSCVCNPANSDRNVSTDLRSLASGFKTSTTCLQNPCIPQLAPSIPFHSIQHTLTHTTVQFARAD